jgi:hypothetical protein
MVPAFASVAPPYATVSLQVSPQTSATPSPNVRLETVGAELIVISGGPENGNEIKISSNSEIGPLQFAEVSHFPSPPAPVQHTEPRGHVAVAGGAGGRTRMARTKNETVRGEISPSAFRI